MNNLGIKTQTMRDMYVVLSRSYDKFHVTNNLIHLNASIFYTNCNLQSDLTDLKETSKEFPLQILVVDLDSKFNLEMEVSMFNITVYKTNIYYFICLARELNKVNYLNSKYDTFLDHLIGSRNTITKALPNMSHNSLFLFRDLDWLSLQLELKKVGIIISGGTISKRHFLSTADFELSILLYKMGYKIENIYNSFKHSTQTIKNNQGDDSETETDIESARYSEDTYLSREFILCQINKEININIDALKDSIQQIENERIVKKEKEISVLKSDIKKKIMEKESLGKKVKNSLRIEKLNLRLGTYKTELKNMKEEILKINSEIMMENKRIEYYNNKLVPLDQLREVFRTNYKIYQLDRDIIEMRSNLKELDETSSISGKRFLSNKPLTHSKFYNSKRRYSTCLKNYSCESWSVTGVSLKKHSVNKTKIGFNNLNPLLGLSYSSSLQQFIRSGGLVSSGSLSFKRLFNISKRGYFISSCSSVSSQSRLTQPLLSGSGLNKNGVQSNRMVSLYKIKTFIRYKSGVSLNKNPFILDSPTFLELKHLLSTSKINNETQLKIENFLLNQGTLFLKERLNKVQSLNYNKLNVKILKELQSSKPDLLIKLTKLRDVRIKERKIKKLFKNKNEINLIINIIEISNEVILSILIGRVLRIISNYGLFNSNTIHLNVAIDIGKELLNTYLNNLYKSFITLTHSQKPNAQGFKENIIKEISRVISYNEFLIKHNYIEFKTDNTLLFKLGSLFIEILLDIELLFLEVKQIKKDEKLNILVPKNSLKFDISKYNLIEIPFKIPMIVPPRDYEIAIKRADNISSIINEDSLSNDKTSNRNSEIDNQLSNRYILGGYLLNDEYYRLPLIIENSHLKDSSIIPEQSSIYNMVNTLSKTAFKINNKMLDFILEEGLNYNLLINQQDLTNLDIELRKLLEDKILIKKNQEKIKLKLKNLIEQKKDTSLVNVDSLASPLQSKDENIISVLTQELSIINHKLRLVLYKISRVSKELESLSSQYRVQLNILGLAQIFKNIPEIYMPVRLDNRGRVYSVVDYLSYQGTDLSKSLLLFSKGEQINKSDEININYFKIFGANCYSNNLSKKSIETRLEWVKNNEGDILDFKNGKLIKDAVNKPLFIAFCFEYLNYYNSLNNSLTYYISHFPIQLDATCNGYQHLALLIGDDALANEVNLNISSKLDNPKDFYGFIALKLKVFFKEQISKFNSNTVYDIDNSKDKIGDLDVFKRLLNMDLHRKLIKIPIMVKPYNATQFRSSLYVKDQFNQVLINEEDLQNQQLDNLDNNLNTNNQDLNNLSVNKINKGEIWYVHKEMSNIKLKESDFMVLIKSIDFILYSEFPKLAEFNKYLKEVAKICCLLNIPIVWTLPYGLTVNQYYLDSDSIRIKPFLHRKNSFSLKISNKKLNVNKQIRALMPNLIHSLDAASLSLLVEFFTKQNNSLITVKDSSTDAMNWKEQDRLNLKNLHEADNIMKFKNIYTIHDCFAVTANNIDSLFDCLKYVYLKIYSEDVYLKKFDDGIIKSIKAQLGEKSFNDNTKIIKLNEMELAYPDINLVLKGKIASQKITESRYLLK